MRLYFWLKGIHLILFLELMQEYLLGLVCLGIVIVGGEVNLTGCRQYVKCICFILIFGSACRVKKRVYAAIFITRKKKKIEFF